MTQLRICLFGAGEMATIHAMNLISDPRVRLAYVVDPSQERAAALAPPGCGASVQSVYSGVYLGLGAAAGGALGGAVHAAYGGRAVFAVAAGVLASVWGLTTVAGRVVAARRRV